jgi:hypothetical protein
MGRFREWVVLPSYRLTADGKKNAPDGFPSEAF